MKKNLTILFSLLMPLMLYACDDMHIHQLNGQYINDENEHWRICDSCNEKVYIEAHIFNEQITTNPTHFTTGNKTYTCKVCGYSYNEEIPKTNACIYDQEVIDDKYLKSEATCVKLATYYKSCKCGAKGRDTFEYGTYIDHLFTNYVSNNDATCTEDGTKSAKCAYCSKVDTVVDEDSKLNHDIIHNDGKDPTCVENGHEPYEYCTRCDYTTFKEVKSLGHDIIYHDGKEATCSEKGYEPYQTCGRCDYTTYKEIDKTAHPTKDSWTSNLFYHYHETTCEHNLCLDTELHSYSEEITLFPTHLTKGSKTLTCDVCGYTHEEEMPLLTTCVYNQEIVDSEYLASEATCCSLATYYKTCICGAIGTDTFEYGDYANHKFINYVSNNDATCTSDGTKTAKCEYCEEVDTLEDSNSKLAHDLVHHDGKLATCYSIGWNAYETCKNCDYSTYQETGLINHDLVHHNAKNPTCIDKGYEAYDTCKNCDYTTYKEIDSLNHDLVHHDAKEPTCGEVGNKAYDTCSRCDYTTYEEIPTVEHTYSDTWSYDSTNHYHSSSCGHDVKKDEQAHSYDTFSINPTHVDDGKNIYTCNVCGYSYEEVVPKLTYHVFNVQSINDKYLKDEATCTSAAVYYKSCLCGEKGTETFTFHKPLGHNLVHHNAKDPTCVEVGWEAYDSCTRCSYSTYNEVDALGHDFKLHADHCERCDYVLFAADGLTVYFGYYPQSLETDETILSSLNGLIGELPTSNNFNNWKVYDYYIEGKHEDYMFYIDLDIDNDNKNDYRGVYFSKYRPGYDSFSSSESTSFIDNNGYDINTVYFFKYESIKWDIVDLVDGKLTLVADLILDAQIFDSVNNSNNYKLSSIRKWLNDDFYNTCFDKYAKDIIVNTTVDNSVSSTLESSNSFVCDDTNDNVFLLSKKEVSTLYSDEQARIKHGTDYAKIQGLYVESDGEMTDGYYTSHYLLRSPVNTSSGYTWYISYDGYYNEISTMITNIGIVPVVVIQIETFE